MSIIINQDVSVSNKTTINQEVCGVIAYINQTILLRIVGTSNI